VGKLADVIVVDRNVLTIPTSQISNAKVLLTLLGGDEVYRAPGF
jgi:predicted amidohydrolase YtcJ